MHALSAESSLTLYHQFGSWINPTPSSGIHLPGCPTPFSEIDFRQSKDLWTAIESGEAELPGQPDIVHSNSFAAPKLPQHIPLVYTVHDLCFWTHPEYTSEKNRIACQRYLLDGLNNADAFIFVSQSSHDDFERILPDWLETNKKPAQVIRSGSRFEPNEATTNCYEDNDAPFLFVGSIEPRKNIDGLLASYSAYHKGHKSPRPLKIIGSPKWFAPVLVDKINAASASLPIEYCGYLEDTQLQHHFETAFAFLFPSHYEGFGLPVIEAMSFGLPCICQDLASVREFAQASALFTDFNQPEIASRSLAQLENDRNKYDSLSAAGRAAVKTQNWKRAAIETLDFYRKVLTLSGKK